MTRTRSRRLLSGCSLLVSVLAPSAALAQTQVLTGVAVGADTQRSFAHTSLPGATGIDFSLNVAFAPLYPLEESHTVVIVFEWGPTPAGPWSASPDHVNTVPGGMTDFFSTGVYRGPDDAPFVAVHFYAGGLMIASGEFTHTSVVPEPAAGLLMSLGLGMLALRRIAGTRARRRSPS